MKRNILIILTILLWTNFAYAVNDTCNALICDKYSPAVWCPQTTSTSLNKFSLAPGHVGEQKATWTMPNNPASGAVDESTAGHPLWVTMGNSNPGVVLVINRETGAIIRSCPTGAANGPNGIAFEPETPSMWITHFDNTTTCTGNDTHALVQMSLTDCTILRTITLPCYPGLIIYHPYTHSMATGTGLSGACLLNLISIATGTVTNTYTLPTGGWPFSLTTTTTHPEYIWLANYTVGSVSKVNTDTGVVTNITTTAYPNGMTYNTYLDKIVISICCGTGANAWTLDPSTNALVETAAVLGQGECSDNDITQAVFGSNTTGGAGSFVLEKLITKTLPSIPSPFMVTTSPSESVLATMLLINFDSLSGGSTILDTSVNAFTVTNSGVTGAASGYSGYAGIFTSTAYASVPYNAKLNAGTGDWAIEWKMKATSLGALTEIFTQASILGHYYSQGYGIYIYYTTNTLHIAQVTVGTHSTAAVSAATLTDGSWHKIKVSHIGGVNSVTLDNVSQTMTDPNDSTNYSMSGEELSYIGGDTRDFAYGLTGSMDDFKLQLATAPASFLFAQDVNY